MLAEDAGAETGRAQSRARVIETREGRVAWHELGRGDGATLVLLHDFTGHRDDFVGVLPALAERRRVLAPDFRGHVNSPFISGSLGCRIEQFVNDMLTYLDALSLERIHVLGHSVGGFVALRAALSAPARFDSISFLL